MNEKFSLCRKQFLMKFLALLYLVPFVAILFLSCDETNMPNETPPLVLATGINDVYNIVWTLESHKKSGKDINVFY